MCPCFADVNACRLSGPHPPTLGCTPRLPHGDEFCPPLSLRWFGGSDGRVLSFYNPFGDLRRQVADSVVAVVVWTQSLFKSGTKRESFVRTAGDE